MATVQGILRYAGSPVGRCWYTAYYKSNNGGSPGPGNGQRASQWMRGVYITEDSGLFSVALSSDNFLGAGATVSNGDQVVVLCWRKSSYTPPEAGGSFFSGQSGTDGKGGTHDVGFKYDSGDNAVANYGEVDQFVAKVFTMTGQAWNATPGGTGGDANGDLVLNLNAGPTAVISGASTSIGAPTAAQRGVSVAFSNGSLDNVTGRDYVFNSQILFQQSSAAHNPSGGVQTADGSGTDGSKYEFFVGELYGQPFGTPAGGDANGADFSSYAGPTFRDHAHVFPHVDIYKVTLTTKDDNAVPLTATNDYFYRINYRTLSISILGRDYCSWDQFVLNPTDANPNWNAANPSTINDVCRVRASVTNPDATVGRINSVARGGIFSKLTGSITLDGTGAMVVSQPDIDDGLPASAPYGFLVMQTHNGADVRHVYEITAKAAGQVTIDTAGSTLTYTARDWWFIATEPAGGTDLHYNWEVNEAGAGWTRVGRNPAALASPLPLGTAVSIVGIGEGTVPGWSLRFIDGPARGRYRIQTVTNDNQIVLAGAGLTVAPNAGDTFEIGCYDDTVFWPHRDNESLNFRVTGNHSTGWATSLGYVHNTVVGPVTQNGSVSNLPPVADLARATVPGAATTYEFDGRKSLGTATTWAQQSTFAAPHTLNGASMFAFSDANIDTTALRDGHAWLLILDATEVVVAVFPIVDVDRESPNATTITIDTLGVTSTYAAGTTFRTTNAYEIEGSNLDNDIASYTWELRSAAAAQTQPTTHAEFVARFDRADGTGSGDQWSYTYAQADDGRFACIELTVTDPKGAAHTTWVMFDVAVSLSGAGGVARRIEWE